MVVIDYSFIKILLSFVLPRDEEWRLEGELLTLVEAQMKKSGNRIVDRWQMLFSTSSTSIFWKIKHVN